MTALWVVLGAALGAPARYLADRWVQGRHGSRYPLGILVVNVLASFLLGLLTAHAPGPAVSALLGTGFCGALSTWSTLGQDTVRLADEGSAGLAVGNVVVSLGAGLAAAGLGLAL